MLHCCLYTIFHFCNDRAAVATRDARSTILWAAVDNMRWFVILFLAKTKFLLNIHSSPTESSNSNRQKYIVFIYWGLTLAVDNLLSKAYENRIKTYRLIAYRKLKGLWNVYRFTQWRFAWELRVDFWYWMLLYSPGETTLHRVFEIFLEC